MENIKALEGRIALVTGATRGIGRGIAVQLGGAGATVYITGRTIKSKDGMGSLEDTAAEIRARGGKCIPVQVDHEDDTQIFELFEQIKREQDGRLDILVNNAYKAVSAIFNNSKLSFWETKPEIWDDVNNVGLRNHYFCTVYAARLMTPRKQGLIVNISSYGGIKYIFNVAYGIGKAALDRMAVDCGTELKKHNVTMLSLYPGAVKTELVKKISDEFEETPESRDKKRGQSFKNIFEDGESTEFSGKIIVQLAQDPNLPKYSSRVLIGAEYAQAHNILDTDNRVIYSVRQFKSIANKVLPNQLNFLTYFIPSFLKVPQFVIDIACSKF